MTTRPAQDTASTEVVRILNPAARGPVVLICEHASNFIPAEFNDLGLSDKVKVSHVAWDPGALAVARGLSQRLDAQLVASGVSRLIYDCNRPPTAADAMPARSEIFEIPGNVDLRDTARAARTAAYYDPFHTATRSALARVGQPVVVTVHSFTPVYMGKARNVDIGILHDSDSRLADAMLAVAADYSGLRVLRNEPYGPQHGVTHTLREHALPSGWLNVMLEIRNDVIATAQQQDNMARTLAAWLRAALSRATDPKEEECRD